VKDPTKSSSKEKEKPYPTDNQGYFPYEESSVAIKCKQILPKGKAKAVASEESNSLRSQRQRILLKEKEAPCDSGDKPHASP